MCVCVWGGVNTSVCVCVWGGGSITCVCVITATYYTYTCYSGEAVGDIGKKGREYKHWTVYVHGAIETTVMYMYIWLYLRPGLVAE